MKLETLIFNKIKRVIPQNSTKTILFALVGQTSYEIFFYTYFTGNDIPRQCFELAEEDVLEENALDTTFESIATLIRDSKEFDVNRTMLLTITIDQSGVKADTQQFEKNARTYGIKKEWKKRYIGE